MARRPGLYYHSVPETAASPNQSEYRIFHEEDREYYIFQRGEGMWELRPNFFIMPAKGGLKMKTIRYIRGYLTGASNSSDIFPKEGRTFSR
jgi:hypothetical protein